MFLFLFQNPETKTLKQHLRHAEFVSETRYDRAMKHGLLSILLLWLSACATTSNKFPEMAEYSSNDCFHLYEEGRSRDVLRTLASISKLYEARCFQEVITLGKYVKEKSRDKVYYFFAETAEFVLPDGSLTDYVLESHERAYLSYLMASSYEKLRREEDSHVQLRQAYQEGQALIYNFGDDPVNMALQAAVWENSTQNLHSRPLWKKAAETSPDDLPLQNFVEQRLKAIDQGAPKKKWNILAYGKFPNIDWEMNMGKKSGGYFDLSPMTSFPYTCSSPGSLLISTESWFRKIAIRHHKDYHPLLNVRSWTRLPVGLTMGAITGIAGVGLGVGGCGLAVAMASDSSSGAEAGAYLCGASLQAAGSMIQSSGNVVRYVLEPDLRRWTQVPEAFLISSYEKIDDDPCFPKTFE